MRNATAPCIVCLKPLVNVFENTVQAQPDNAVMFTATGNYGSTVYDPGGLGGGGYLQIHVCDSCMLLRQRHVLSVVPHKAPTTYEFSQWNPDDDD